MLVVFTRLFQRASAIRKLRVCSALQTQKANFGAPPHRAMSPPSVPDSLLQCHAQEVELNSRCPQEPGTGALRKRVRQTPWRRPVLKIHANRLTPSWESTESHGCGRDWSDAALDIAEMAEGSDMQ